MTKKRDFRVIFNKMCRGIRFMLLFFWMCVVGLLFSFKQLDFHWMPNWISAKLRKFFFCVCLSVLRRGQLWGRRGMTAWCELKTAWMQILEMRDLSALINYSPYNFAVGEERKTIWYHNDRSVMGRNAWLFWRVMRINFVLWIENSIIDSERKWENCWLVASCKSFVMLSWRDYFLTFSASSDIFWWSEDTSKKNHKIESA